MIITKNNDRYDSDNNYNNDDDNNDNENLDSKSDGGDTKLWWWLQQHKPWNNQGCDYNNCRLNDDGIIMMKMVM